MKIRFLGTTSTIGNCPMLFDTDEGDYVAVATIVADPDVLATVESTYAGIGEGEIAVRFPKELLKFASEADGA